MDLLYFTNRKEAEDFALEMRRWFPRAGVRKVGVILAPLNVRDMWRVELD